LPGSAVGGLSNWNTIEIGDDVLTIPSCCQVPPLVYSRSLVTNKIENVVATSDAIIEIPEQLISRGFAGIEVRDAEKYRVRAAVPIRQEIGGAGIWTGHGPEFPEEVAQICESRKEVSVIDCFWRTVELEHIRWVRK